MDRRAMISILLFLLLISSGFGQANSANVGKKVKPVEIRDMNNNPVMLPKLGEKHLLIFYVDPDKPNQNKQFIEHLEANHIQSDEIYGFGMINLKDAPMLPNAIVRPMADKRARKNNAIIYSDPDHLLRDAWGLGDCNNKFVILFVSKDMIIEFCRWGDFTQADIDEFYRIIDKFQ